MFAIAPTPSSIRREAPSPQSFHQAFPQAFQTQMSASEPIPSAISPSRVVREPPLDQCLPRLHTAHRIANQILHPNHCWRANPESYGTTSYAWVPRPVPRPPLPIVSSPFPMSASLPISSIRYSVPPPLFVASEVRSLLNSDLTIQHQNVDPIVREIVHQERLIIDRGLESSMVKRALATAAIVGTIFMMLGALLAHTILGIAALSLGCLALFSTGIAAVVIAIQRGLNDQDHASATAIERNLDSLESSFSTPS